MYKPAFAGLAVAVGIAGGLALTSCSSPKEVRADAPRRVTVAVARATRQNLSQTMELAAEFRPYQQIDVHAKVAGYVKHIYVDVGDHVKQGQVLAVLEVPELADELNQASAAAKSAENEVQRAQSDLQRAVSAHTVDHLAFQRLNSVVKLRPNLVAQQEIDAAAGHDREAEAQIDADKAALAAAQSQVSAALANKERVETLLAYTRITAPFTGVVTDRLADTGAMVQAGTASNTQAMPVVRLSQNDRLRLVLPVPETAVPRIHLGEPVAVRVSALNHTFEGKVARFSQKVDQDTRTMETEVDVLNPQLTLMPGMYAYATLTLDRRPDALTVPIQAVSVLGRNATALVVNSDKEIERRAVKVGIETPTKVEILAGLKPDDLVVIGNRNQLRAGQRVEPKLIAPTAAEGSL